MTHAERATRRVPSGVEAYRVTLDIPHSEEIMLLRVYDISNDDFLVRAFTPRQWEAVKNMMHDWRDDVNGDIAADGPDVGADVPGGGAV